MHVSEVFHSIQGEGALAGMPSTFIRLAHCNLTCSWCDAAYTWRGNVAYMERDLLDVVNEVEHGHVVVTGGEPTYAADFDALVFQLACDRRHVTVETNGTIWRAEALPHVALWSVSPKLGSSGQAPMLDEGVLREYLRLVAGSVQWKFVIDNEGDFAAALLLMRRLGMSDGRSHQVFMQPNGLCHTAAIRLGRDLLATETRGAGTEIPFHASNGPHAKPLVLETPYLDRLRWLYELVIAADAAGDLPCPVRAVPQSHKLAWGNRRGF